MATSDMQQFQNDNENERNKEHEHVPADLPLPSRRSPHVLNPSEIPLRPKPETRDVKEEKPAYLEDLELNHDVEWIKRFKWIKIVLILFGRWPFTHSAEPHNRGYVFKFSCLCPGFLIFVITFVFTLYGLIVCSINVIDILMTDKVQTVNSRTFTQIVEQGLVERHTMILIIMLGSSGINTVTLFFIFVKRNQISETFTKWTRFLQFSKLSGASTKSYATVAAGNYMIVLSIYLVLTMLRASATFIGGPTVIAIIFTRQFFPDNYLDNFVGTSRHKMMHATGVIIYIYVVTACNIHMYMFLWLLKSIESAFHCWNARMIGVVEPPAKASPATETGEESKSPAQHQANHPNHPRLTYQALYRDHIGLVRMLSWFNNMFAYTFEPSVLFLVIKLVYQMYLAALVMKSSGKPLNAVNVGKYFIRKRDYIPAALLTYESCVMLLLIFLASSWLEDTAYESYDVLRKHCLLNGTTSDRQSFFFLSMFQSYTSTTRMAVSGGHYFCVDKYTILHALSAIMSNFLVVYQFAPMFDMDTVEYPQIRNTMGKFLESFEGLPPNHTLPVADSQRNRIGF